MPGPPCREGTWTPPVDGMDGLEAESSLQPAERPRILRPLLASWPRDGSELSASE